jgi:hypothetical protein
VLLSALVLLLALAGGISCDELVSGAHRLAAFEQPA